MKKKKFLLTLVFLITVLLIGSLLSTSKNHDTEVWEFTNQFSEVSDKVIKAIEDTSDPDFQKAQTILDQNKESLKKKYEKLRKSKGKQVTDTTQLVFYKVLDNAFNKIVKEIPTKYLTNVEDRLSDLTEKEKIWNEKKDEESLANLKAVIIKLEKDEENLDKVEKIVDGFNFILQKEEK